MATIGELPYELLQYIILLLVQLPGGEADFSRIVSVCRKFLLFAQDKHVLKHVSFDSNMEFRKYKRYQHINSLLVKCSEAGNVAAQFMLGKVILVSSSQLLLGEWKTKERLLHHCDFSTLNELIYIFAPNVPTQNQRVASFVEYFLPKQVSTSEFSLKILVHYQLVKVFLLNGSHNDLFEMYVFLKSYIKFFTSVTEEDNPLLKCIKALVSHADDLRGFEKMQMELYRRFAGHESSERIFNAVCNKLIVSRKIVLAESREEALRVFELTLG